MPDSENLRMIELLKQFRSDVINIEEVRSAQLFKEARNSLQSIYAYHLQKIKCFKEVDYFLKNLYASFNFAASMINEAAKKKALTGESVAQLDECLEAMINCCDTIIAKLKKK